MRVMIRIREYYTFHIMIMHPCIYYAKWMNTSNSRSLSREFNIE